MSISCEDLDAIQQKYVYMIATESTQTIDNIKLQASELVIPRIFQSMLHELVGENIYQRIIIVITDQQQNDLIEDKQIAKSFQFQYFLPSEFYSCIQQCQSKQKATVQKYYQDSTRSKLASYKIVACQQIILLYKQFLTLNLQIDQKQYYESQIIKYEKTIQQSMKQQSPYAWCQINYQPKIKQFQIKNSDSQPIKNATGLTAATPIISSNNTYMIGGVSPLPCENPNLARFYVNEQLANIKGKYQCNNCPTLIINQNPEGCCMQQGQSSVIAQDLSTRYKNYEQQMKKVIIFLNKVYFQRIQECKRIEAQIRQYIEDVNNNVKTFKIINETQEQNKSQFRRQSLNFSHNSTPVNVIKTQWFNNEQSSQKFDYNRINYDMDYDETDNLKIGNQLIYQSIESNIRPYFCYDNDVIQINNWYIYKISKKFTVFETVRLLTKSLMYSDQQYVAQKENQCKISGICLQKQGYYHLFEKNNTKQKRMIETSFKEDAQPDECMVCGCRFACYKDHINTKNHIQEFRNCLHNQNIREESFVQLMKATTQENVVNQQLTDILMTSSLMTGRSWIQTQQKLSQILKKFKIQRTQQFLDQTMNPMNYTPEFYNWAQEISQQRANLTEQICQKINENNVNTKYLLLMNKIINNAIVEDMIIQKEYHVPLDALKQNTKKQIQKEIIPYDSLTNEQIYMRKMLNCQYPEIQQPLLKDEPQEKHEEMQQQKEEKIDQKVLQDNINRFIQILQTQTKTIHKLMTYKIKETKIKEQTQDQISQQQSQVTTQQINTKRQDNYNINILNQQQIIQEQYNSQQTKQSIKNKFQQQLYIKVSKSQPYLHRNQVFDHQFNIVDQDPYKQLHQNIQRSQSQVYSKRNYTSGLQNQVYHINHSTYQTSNKDSIKFIQQNQFIGYKCDKSLAFIRSLENPYSKLSNQYEMCQKICLENKKKQISTQGELLKNSEGKHYQISPLISNCQLQTTNSINVNVQKSIYSSFYGIFALLYGTQNIQKMLNQREYNIVDSLIGYSNAVNFNKNLQNAKIEVTSLLFEQIEFIGTILQCDDIV